MTSFSSFYNSSWMLPFSRWSKWISKWTRNNSNVWGTTKNYWKSWSTSHLQGQKNSATRGSDQETLIAIKIRIFQYTKVIISLKIAQVISCKVMYPKYSKHWPCTVANTINCVCSKLLDYDLNHGLFRSLFKLIPCHIHWIVYVLAYLNFIFEFYSSFSTAQKWTALPKHIKV